MDNLDNQDKFDNLENHDNNDNNKNHDNNKNNESKDLPAFKESGIFDPSTDGEPELIGFSPNADFVNTDLPSDTDLPEARFDDLVNERGELDVPEIKVKKKKKVIHDGGGPIRSLAVSIAILSACLILGLVCGVFVLSVANDLFSFVYDKDELGEPVVYTVTIDDAGLSPREVGELLKEEGVIRYPFIFKLYAQLKKKDNFAVKCGTYTILSSANYDSIMTALNPTPPREEVTITFTDTMTTDDVIDLFLANGIGTREGFEEAINEYNYSYWFMEYLTPDQLSPDRYYRLDGYLYPDTYRFFTDSSEVAAIDKMLANFDRYFGEIYKTACEERSMTPDQIVTLASMVQAEAKRVTDFSIVAAVFDNRMKSKTFEGRLDSDATVQYYFRHVEGARHDKVTSDDLKVDTPYNTYLYKGLTPGAVCNPSINALRAALYPEEDCPYYYFVSRSNGVMLYAKTLAEHNKNIETVKKEDSSSGVGGYE